MKFKKSYIVDILILIIPVIIMILLMPVLPDKVPLQWGFDGTVNRSIDKNFSFILGFIPFILYKLIKYKYRRRK